MNRLLAGAVLLSLAAAGAPTAAESLTELMAAAKRSEGRIIFENDHVRVHNTILEYPSAPRRIAEDRPVVLYVRLGADTGFARTRLLEAPRGSRMPWRPGVVPLGIWIELLKPPPRYSSLGDPDTYPPRDAEEQADWGNGSLYVATFRPFNYYAGLGPHPAIAVFLSEGVVEVATRGLRRRIPVQPGYAEWFDSRTRLTVVDDYTVGVAFIQVPVR